MKKISSVLLIAFSVLLATKSQAQISSRDLGPQVTASVIQGSVFVRTGEGSEYLYTVLRGRPASLLGFSLDGNKKILDQPLSGTDGSWDLVVSTDGIVYIAGANGHLFSHFPGTDMVQDIGIPLAGEKLIWDMTAGKSGEIFGGTYPGCRAFRYHPKEGFTDIGKGPVVEGEQYLRSIEYHATDDKLYAGIGSHANLVEIDPRTGKKSDWLPEQYKDQQYIYSIGLVNGLKKGDLLFGWLTSSTPRRTLVFNLRTDQLETVLEDFDVRSVIKSRSNQKVYFTQDGSLIEADFSKTRPTLKKITQTGMAGLASYWDKTGSLRMIGQGGKLLSYDPKTSKHTIAKLELPRRPIDIQSIGVAPDGKVWIGGYLAGGHAVYNPVTQTTTALDGLDQTEGLAFKGDTLYLGIYPKSHVYLYDMRKAWMPDHNQPRHLGKLKGQDRPFAVLPMQFMNKVFFGTVPDYGKLGGALVEYDIELDTLIQFDEVVSKQSVISLVEAKGLVIGGTSISGGLGIQPVEKEGKLFIWDPVQRRKVEEIIPVPGAIAITGLSVAPDGKIWGFAQGIVFVYDLEKRKVTAMSSVYPAKPVGSHVWRNAFIVHHPNGNVYMSANNDIFQVDPKTMAVTRILEGAGMLIMDKNGTLYYKKSTNLFRLEL